MLLPQVLAVASALRLDALDDKLLVGRRLVDTNHSATDRHGEQDTTDQRHLNNDFPGVAETTFMSLMSHLQ